MALRLSGIAALTVFALAENQAVASVRPRVALRRRPQPGHPSKSELQGASFARWDTAPPAKNAKFEEMAAPCGPDTEWLQPGEHDSLSFRCLVGSCVSMEGRCNGFYNCGDGSDELDCPKRRPDEHLKKAATECTGLQLNIDPGSHDSVTFRCLDGACVSMEARCNGLANCGDETDEWECHGRAHALDHAGHRSGHEVSHPAGHDSGHAHTGAHTRSGSFHGFISRSKPGSAILSSRPGDEEPDGSPSLTAELSEAGYKAVLSLDNNTEEMGTFVRRVIAREGLVILDEGSLSGMLPYYSGECKAQSLADLVEEVHAATLANKCHGQWTAFAPPPPPAPLEQPADSTVGPGGGVNLASGVHHMASASQERAFPWRAAQADVLGYVQQSRLADALPHIGETASLDQHGYRQVVAEHSSLEMSLFIRRVLKKHRLVADETALQYCVPWHSGECEAKSYHSLVGELHEGITRSAHCGGPWVERLPKSATPASKLSGRS